MERHPCELSVTHYDALKAALMAVWPLSQEGIDVVRHTLGEKA
jgi:hypothetical protein